MHREIKFRGKTLNGEWAYGYYVGETCDRVYIVEQSEVKYDCGYIDTTVANECFPETVGQFAGLTDCNSTEIYEGDIMKITHNNIVHDKPEISYVVFEGGSYKLKHNNAYLHNVLNISGYKVEVIGNIHDNPKLELELVKYDLTH